MKKICMLLIFLSGVSFAVDLQKDICQKQELGGCETLFICPNNVSLIVKYEMAIGGCIDRIVSQYFIDTKEQKVIEMPNKK